MVKKLQKLSADKKKSNAQLSSTVKDSAQQIWLAGLGAFSKAQEEGGKVFEALVKEGLTIQRKTQAVAEEKITEATSRVTTMASMNIRKNKGIPATGKANPTAACASQSPNMAKTARQAVLTVPTAS